MCSPVPGTNHENGVPVSVRVTLYSSRYAPDYIDPQTRKRLAAEKKRCETTTGDSGSES